MKVNSFSYQTNKCPNISFSRRDLGGRVSAPVVEHIEAMARHRLGNNAPVETLNRYVETWLNALEHVGRTLKGTANT